MCSRAQLQSSTDCNCALRRAPPLPLSWQWGMGAICMCAAYANGSWGYGCRTAVLWQNPTRQRRTASPLGARRKGKGASPRPSPLYRVFLAENFSKLLTSGRIFQRSRNFMFSRYIRDLGRMRNLSETEQCRIILDTRSMRIETTLILSKWLTPGRVLRTPPCFLQGGRRFGSS